MTAIKPDKLLQMIDLVEDNASFESPAGSHNCLNRLQDLRDGVEKLTKICNTLYEESIVLCERIDLDTQVDSSVLIDPNVFKDWENDQRFN